MVMMIGAAVLRTSPSPRVGVFLIGMGICAVTCTILPTDRSGTGGYGALLFPLWPAWVAVDGIWRWMQRVGFGRAFRVSVTAVLFGLCWSPLFPKSHATDL